MLAGHRRRQRFSPAGLVLGLRELVGLLAAGLAGFSVISALLS
jgi:hypothetical protein